MKLAKRVVREPYAREVVAMNDRLRQAPPAEPYTAESLQAARQRSDDLESLTSRRVEIRSVVGDSSSVPIRIIHAEENPTAVLISLHQGGWCFGSAKADDWLNDILVSGCAVTTIAVDYRLAPEHPYPAALTDIVAVASWLGDNCRSEFGTDRLIIAGSSAGAHLGAQLLLRLRAERPDVLARVLAVALAYGAYDIGGTPSLRTVGKDSPVVNKIVHEQLLDYAFPDLSTEARRDPAISPLYADVSGMPPTMFTVGTLDSLLDDTLFMATRWEAAGNQTALEIWPDCDHAFDTFSATIGLKYAQAVTAWFSRFL